MLQAKRLSEKIGFPRDREWSAVTNSNRLADKMALGNSASGIEDLVCDAFVSASGYLLD